MLSLQQHPTIGWCMWNVIIYNFEFGCLTKMDNTMILNVVYQLFDILVTDVIVTN